MQVMKANVPSEDNRFNNQPKKNEVEKESNFDTMPSVRKKDYKRD